MLPHLGAGAGQAIEVSAIIIAAILREPHAAWYDYRMHTFLLVSLATQSRQRPQLPMH